jgi:hypothetical protein
MNSLQRQGLNALLFISAMFYLSACSTLNRLPPDEREPAQRKAEAALQKLYLVNSRLTSFKGIGRIRLTEPNKPTLSERVAWIGSLPNKLAIAVLVSGRPVLKIAADGDHLYAVDLQNSSRGYRKIKTSDPRLERLIRIPATVGDLNTILAGRVPIRDHSRAYLKLSPSNDEFVLVLEKWWTVIQKIYLNELDLTVQRFEIFHRNGTLLYQGEIIDTQMIQGYRIPSQVRLSNDNGIILQLHIERFMADVPIVPDIFILMPPDSTTP